MQACCCSMAGTAACIRCRQNNLSNWYTNQQIQQFPSPYYPAQPSPVVPALVIDYDKLADKIAERLRGGKPQPAQETADTDHLYRTGS